MSGFVSSRAFLVMHLNIVVFIFRSTKVLRLKPQIEYPIFPVRAGISSTTRIECFLYKSVHRSRGRQSALA